MPDEPVFIFLHLPKTAGTTFREILDRQYPPGQILNFDGNEAAAEATVRMLGPEQLAALRIIRGHLPYGLHRALGRPARYLTILRDPVERVISLYFHVWRNHHHYCHAQVGEGKMPLIEFVRGGLTLETDNAQARMLAGPEQLPFGTCGQSLLDTVRENLARDFDLIGLTEAFEETVLVAREVLGWRRWPCFAHRNVGWNKGLASVSDADQKIVREFNWVDQAVYDEARKMLSECAARHCPHWPSLVPSLRRRNFVYQKWTRLRKAIGRLASRNPTKVD
jgi:hypothetical protein